jgi:hypothetical protein
MLGVEERRSSTTKRKAADSTIEGHLAVRIFPKTTTANDGADT